VIGVVHAASAGKDGHAVPGTTGPDAAAARALPTGAATAPTTAAAVTRAAATTVATRRVVTPTRTYTAGRRPA